MILQSEQTEQKRSIIQEERFCLYQNIEITYIKDQIKEEKKKKKNTAKNLILLWISLWCAEVSPGIVLYPCPNRLKKFSPLWSCAQTHAFQCVKKLPFLVFPQIFQRYSPDYLSFRVFENCLFSSSIAPISRYYPYELL